MKREDVEKAAREYELRRGASESASEMIAGFAIQQINAALEEAESSIKNAVNEALHEIRWLKIGAGE